VAGIWHLPSDEEWNLLINKYGGEDEAGKSLKSTTDWENDGNGTNSSGFNGMPAGYRDYDDGTFSNIEMGGYFWSSSEARDVSRVATLFELQYFLVYRDEGHKGSGYSCRCLRD